jgi:hypothetical protein
MTDMPVIERSSMEISPGVEIAWNLAGIETRAARTKQIEPDHFFCGLLKLSETNENEMEYAQASKIIIEALKNELEQLRAILNKNSINSTVARREIRRVNGIGFARSPEGEALHRSDASREVFERAARASFQNKGILDAPLLLQTFLARPTPAMVKVLGKTVVAEQEPKQETHAGEISPNRYLQELPFLVDKEPENLELVSPQIQVLSWALRRTGGKPLCLICAGSVAVTSLLRRATKTEGAEIRILQVNSSDLLKDASKPAVILDRAGDLFVDRGKDVWIYFDLTDLKLEKVCILLEGLKPFIEANNYRQVFALHEGLFNQIIDDLLMDGLFHEIWLHELKDSRIPSQL